MEGQIPSYFPNAVCPVGVDGHFGQSNKNIVLVNFLFLVGKVLVNLAICKTKNLHKNSKPLTLRDAYIHTD